MTTKEKILLRFFGIRKNTTPFKPDSELRIFSTELPKRKMNYFIWAKKFNVGTAYKNHAIEDRDLVR